MVGKNGHLADLGHEGRGRSWRSWEDMEGELECTLVTSTSPLTGISEARASPARVAGSGSPSLSAHFSSC